MRVLVLNRFELSFCAADLVAEVKKGSRCYWYDFSNYKLRSMIEFFHLYNNRISIDSCEGSRY